MLRWVVDGALRFRLLVIALGVGVLVAGVQQAQQHARRRAARVRAAVDRGADRGARPLGARGREPGDAQPRGAPERHAVAEVDPLDVGAGALVDPAHVRAGHRRPARPPARAGAADALVRDPERRQAADHHPAALDDEPGDDGRASRRRRSRRSRWACSPAGTSGRRCWPSPASPTSPSGASASASCRCRSSRSGCSPPTSRSTRSSRTTGNAHVGVAADLPAGLDARQRRLDRHPQPAARGAPHLPDLDGGRPGQGAASTAHAPLRLLGDVANVVADHQPLIGDAFLTGGEDSLLVIEKFPNANTLEVTRGVEKALEKLQPGPGRHHDRHVGLAPGDLHRRRDLEPDARGRDRRGAPDHRASARCCTAGAPALIAAVSIPLSLAAALLVLDLRGETVNLMIVAGLVIALAAARRRRRHLHASRCATAACARASCEARRSVVYVTLIALLPLSALPVLRGRRPGRRRAARARLPAGRPRLGGRLGHRHPGARPAPSPPRGEHQLERLAAPAPAARALHAAPRAGRARAPAGVHRLGRRARPRRSPWRRRSASRCCRRSATPTWSCAGTPRRARREPEMARLTALVGERAAGDPRAWPTSARTSAGRCSATRSST